MLYANGEHNNKVIVNAGKWIPTLKLNPFSSLITKNQHHTIFSVGFSTTLKVLQKLALEAEHQNQFDSVFKINGEIVYHGSKCFVMKIEDKSWHVEKYKAQHGETIYSIANKFLIPEFAILKLNSLKDLSDDVSGKILNIPSSYASNTTLYVDEKTFFPVYQSLVDLKNNEFERYEFSNVQINPTFQPNEFSEKFKEYGF